MKCLYCGKEILEEDVFCGYCGKNIEEEQKKQEEKKKIEEEEILKKNLENEMKKFAEDIIIKCEGNKFKAIKDFKDKFNVDNDLASNYINNAYKMFDNNNQPDNAEEKKEISNFNTYVDPKGIKKTIIVASSSRKKASSAITRGIIGGAILGPVGLLAGASAKKKETTTFQVIYNSGKQETITVDNNSYWFNEYCKYLDN